jgi:5'-3' exonuclease
VLDVQAVVEKFGVRPDQVRDYICLCGDTSDNIIGAKGIGPKRAAGMLQQFGSLKEMYSAFDRASATERRLYGFTPAIVDSLTEFAGRLDEVRQLVTLRTDAPIPFDEVFAPRVSQAAAEYDPEADYAAEEESVSENEQDGHHRAGRSASVSHGGAKACARHGDGAPPDRPRAGRVRAGA